MRKYKIFTALFFGIVILFFFSRFYNIMSLPIFTDEAIYVRWSQIAKQDANWRFISLTDGKQPSFVWFTMVMMRFVSDPLMAGRLVSVLAGFITMLGLFFVGKELFRNRWIGFFSAALYVIFPMALVYDRMALYDSLVGMFMIWSLFLAILLVRTIRLDVALVLGMVIGAGTLTKSNSFFSMPLLIATFLLFDFGQKAWKSKLLKLAVLSALSIFMAFGFYSILRLSPYFHIIAEKNATFAYPFNDWIQHPIQYFVSNVRGLFDWLLAYFTLPLLLLVTAAFIFTKKINRKQCIAAVGIFIPLLVVLFMLQQISTLNIVRIEPPLFHPYIFFVFFLFSLYISRINNEYFKEKIILFIWFVVPFVYLAFFGKTIYPRFIFFMAIFLLPLAAFSLWSIYSSVSKKLLFLPIFLLITVFPLRSNYFILTDFANAPIPESDLGQYINSWPAGGGIKEIITFLEKKASREKIYVATEGTFGSLPTNSVEIYLGENKNVEKRGIWPLPIRMPEDLIKKAKVMPVYFIFNETQYPPPPVDWPLRFIVKYKKGISQESYISLYQVENR